MNEPIVAHLSSRARVATRAGQAVAAERFVANVESLATRLPACDYVLNGCRDRYAFAVTFCAALVAGRVNLLPPSFAPEALSCLVARFPRVALVADGEGARVDGLPTPIVALSPQATHTAWPPPRIARERIAAIAFTSGSTGEPQPQPKTWGGIVDGARAERSALGFDEEFEAHVLVGTVSAQHMYGLESTVLLALHGPCAFAAEHPLHPDEVIDTLARSDGHRVLVSTPLHLSALLDADRAPPPLACVVSATAPLPSQLAASCEAAWRTRVMEVYGCTETGMVATRRTVEGPLWRAMRDVEIQARGEAFWACGGHVARPGPLADRLRLASATQFELLGRAADLINIGGKRASLEGLNRLLLAIPGVRDGVFFLPDAAPAAQHLRPIALVVAPELAPSAIAAALRKRIDPVFVPRPLLMVDALPRNAQGKLARADLLALAARARKR
jgi:acyl-coenzyme A synthetase/AMP-(fatty) acid ligase